MLLLAERVNNPVEDTQLESDGEIENMETESILHDNVYTDTLSKCERWYLRFNASNGKEVYSIFELFKTDGVDMSKVDHLIMQKSKDFYLIQKKKGNAVNIAGLIFTEEDSISGWVNRQEKDLKIKMPDTFDKLESFNNGHNFECFHNLDVDVINEETKALHHSAFLFFERKKSKINCINCY